MTALAFLMNTIAEAGQAFIGIDSIPSNTVLSPQQPGTLLRRYIVNGDLIEVKSDHESSDALREADRSKDEFLAKLAHELRNPLAPIRGAVHLLQQQNNLPPDCQWAIDVIDRQMQHMTHLVDDLMDVSRISRNKLELRKERIDLSDAVKAAIETSRPLITQAGHKLSVDLPTQTLPLDADLTRLTQVFAALLNNAARHMNRNGRIWLTVQRLGSEVLVTVRDTGVGISAGVLPHVFDIFTQVNQSAAQSQGGLGIGLTLAKRLTELHGGTIEARSGGLGQGSEFIVRLPIAFDAQATGADRDVPVSLMGLRVLVVDDHLDSGECLSRVMRRAGNDVRLACDGMEAIQSAAAFQPDVILLDIGLPRMNGYEAARHIRRQTWGRQATLIAVTGWGQEGDRQKSKDAGFDHHLVKPVDAETLLELLANSTKE
jgi:signal transduction histidine kinase